MRDMFGDKGQTLILPGEEGGLLEGLNTILRRVCGDPGALLLVRGSSSGDGIKRSFSAAEWGVLIVRTTVCFILLLNALPAL